MENPFVQQVRASAGRLVWLGVAFALIGIVALVYPMVSTLAVALFVGWLLVIAGVVAVYTAFAINAARPSFGLLLFGLLCIGAGAYMLARPVAGEVVITLILGMLFMLQGASEMAFAFELRPASGWTWILLSALASIVLSLAILVGWPATSLITLGILIGINFLSSGVTYLALGLAAKRGPGA
jgi:uncharacterized membrane protein HdeD (DUF308 family)